MKKYIYSVLSVAFALFALASCSYDDGVERGGDEALKVTLYNYEVSLPLQADNDTHVRACCNNLVKEVYYMSFTEDEYAKLSEPEVIEKVKKDGKSAELTPNAQDGGSVAEFDVTGMMGSCRIACVGVNGGNNTLSSIEFFGLAWKDVCKGTYKFNGKLASFTGASVETTLQKCTNKEGVYRFKDLYGTGYHLKFYVAADAQDADGEDYKVIYTPYNATSYVHSNYGAISTRDVYTWQGNNADYLNGQLYEKYGYVALWMNYYVAAGSFGYGWEEFTAAE